MRSAIEDGLILLLRVHHDAQQVGRPIPNLRRRIGSFPGFSAPFGQAPARREAVRPRIFDRIKICVEQTVEQVVHLRVRRRHHDAADVDIELDASSCASVEREPAGPFHVDRDASSVLNSPNMAPARAVIGIRDDISGHASSLGARGSADGQSRRGLAVLVSGMSSSSSTGARSSPIISMNR
ncbi:hypothetical protein XI00_26130 [Bradyrhizobium sp. CCBAU 21359]|nr:hypothetical protein [Bradyrhizobium sp. CCBAU 21360]MDA9457655.1 hypothetical protein [Bradyrhizobium sp. CCBAU 21359]